MHSGECKPEFEFSTVKVHRSALGRQLHEGILIERDQSDNHMNSRSEFGRNHIVIQRVQCDKVQYSETAVKVQESAARSEKRKQEDQEEVSSRNLPPAKRRKNASAKEEGRPSSWKSTLSAAPKCKEQQSAKQLDLREWLISSSRLKKHRNGTE